MAKKLPKAERRAQLLDMAHALIREQGTDALTLGALAERAGVSKPIVYNHFETRAGLMIALYKEINDRLLAAWAAALERVPPRLADVARLVADAYMDCYTAVGPEWHAIAAALRGDAAMESYQREMVDNCVAFYQRALAPHTDLPAGDLRRRCVAIVGAAEALSDAMVHGSASRDQASAELASLITSWLSPRPE